MFLFLTQLTLLKELKEHFENTHLNGKKKHILDTYAELSNVLERMPCYLMERKIISLQTVVFKCTLKIKMNKWYTMLVHLAKILL